MAKDAEVQQTKSRKQRVTLLVNNNHRFFLFCFVLASKLVFTQFLSVL